MRQSSLLIIFLIVFIDLVGFGIVIPILPYYAQSYHASAWALGWLMAVYSLMQFVFAPVWGRISDFVGRRPILLVSLLGTSASMAILGLAGSLQWLFIGRIFAGFCGANISTAYAYIADVTSEKDRAKGMGMIGAAFGLGFIFGPAIGGVLSRYGYSFPMFVGALMALCNFCFAFLKLEEPELEPQTRSEHRNKRFDLETIRMALGDGRTRIAITAFFLVTFAVAQMETVFAIYLGARFNYNAENAGVLLAIMGLVMVVVQGMLIGKLVARYGETRLILAGTLLCSLALSWFASVNSIAVIVISLTLMALGHGVLHPSLSSLASMGTSAQTRGGTMGVFQSASSLARILGPPCAGWLYDHISWRSPFYGGSLVLVLAFFSVGLWFMNSLKTQPSLNRASV